MATRSPPRAERLLDLVSFFLQADGPIDWDALARSFPDDYGGGKVLSAKRKWDRDRAALLDLGIPLQWVERGEGGPGYVVDRSRYYMRELDLEPRERALLSIAGAAALEQPGFPLRTDLGHALAKLLFWQDRSREGQQLPPPLVMHLPISGAKAQSIALEQLGTAVAERREVTLHYRAFDGVDTDRQVAPYGLAYRRGAWFLVGHCRLRNALRTFQVERIRALQVAKEPRSFSVPADFDLRNTIGREPWQFAVHAPVVVSLLLDPTIAPLGRSLFGEEARLDALGDGSSLITISVTHDEAIVRELLRLAPKAELLEPPALRQRVEEIAAKLGAAHEGTPAAARGRARATDGPAEGRESALSVGLEGAEGDGESIGPEEGVEGGESALSVDEVRADRRSGTSPAATPGAGELGERMRRALSIVPYVAAHPGCTVDEVAAVTGMAAEDLLVELDFLKMIGRPPFSPADLIDIDLYDGRLSVKLPQGLHRPPSLTPLEAAALDAAASALAVEGGAALAGARQKLRDALPPEGQEAFDSIAGRVQVTPGGLGAEEARLIDAAIVERLELEFTYWTAGRGEAARRTVRPLERLLHQGYWYLYAYCCDRRERRLFRLDRAVDLQASDRSFLPRASGDRERFRSESLFKPAQRGGMALIKIASGPWASREQALRLGATEVRHLEDGSVEAIFPVEGVAYIVSTVLTLGGEAELVEPRELREQVNRNAEAARLRHSLPRSLGD